jgi:hypothetical protein
MSKVQTLSPQLRSVLEEIGQALDIDRQLAVGDAGEVFINPHEERAEHAERECKGAAGGQGAQRRAGERLWARQAAGSCAPPWFRGGSLAEHYLLAENEVRERYDANLMISGNGLWVVAPSCPLGADGPQFHLAVAFPFSIGLQPKGWAFSKLGQFPKAVGPRHTNFPDHSICAQGADDGAWYPSDGVRPLLNLYSTWLFRQIYLAEFRRWPGRQWGPSALYRRSEFHQDEWCGCGKKARYGKCCQQADLEISDDEARQEHIRISGGEYRQRRVPKEIMNFARSDWKKVPRIGSPA